MPVEKVDKSVNKFKIAPFKSGKNVNGIRKIFFLCYANVTKRFT